MDGSDAIVRIVAAKPLEVLVGQKEGAHDQHNVTSAKMILEVYKADGCEKCNFVWKAMHLRYNNHEFAMQTYFDEGTACTCLRYARPACCVFLQFSISDKYVTIGVS